MDATVTVTIPQTSELRRYRIVFWRIQYKRVLVFDPPSGTNKPVDVEVLSIAYILNDRDMPTVTLDVSTTTSILGQVASRTRTAINAGTPPAAAIRKATREVLYEYLKTIAVVPIEAALEEPS